MFTELLSPTCQLMQTQENESSAVKLLIMQCLCCIYMYTSAASQLNMLYTAQVDHHSGKTGVTQLTNFT